MVNSELGSIIMVLSQNHRAVSTKVVMFMPWTIVDADEWSRIEVDDETVSKLGLVAAESAYLRRTTTTSRNQTVDSKSYSKKEQDVPVVYNEQVADPAQTVDSSQAGAGSARCCSGVKSKLMIVPKLMMVHRPKLEERRKLVKTRKKTRSWTKKRFEIAKYPENLLIHSFGSTSLISFNIQELILQPQMSFTETVKCEIILKTIYLAYSIETSGYISSMSKSSLAASAKAITGCVILLQLWAWERILTVQPKILGGELDLSHCPLGTRWSREKKVQVFYSIISDSRDISPDPEDLAPHGHIDGGRS
ncbi:OLC1v1012857C1 [Oldenlandia corymbosa var. corymbosa]|uniref:OLC1v1012857C1 n=1 Tax=Oldenlandia corymbosa var. corymbosa TaxID=529605 RepID=A0AAV1E046_OLDCO|nr:OLC1v1012857C1 [Oldenlandia corymbosa var. corymbosa]